MDFLNKELADRSVFGPYIKFGVATGTNLASCQVTSPHGVQPFAVTFSKNLCTLLGFNVNTTIAGQNPALAPVRASKSCDPYADFKLIEIKCGNVDGFTTSQSQAPDSLLSDYPETTVALFQVSRNYPVDDSMIVVTPTTGADPSAQHTISIPMESVVFYPMSAQTVYSLNFKLLSLSSQLLKVDTSLPVVLHIILRKANHSFV